MFRRLPLAPGMLAAMLIGCSPAVTNTAQRAIPAAMAVTAITAVQPAAQANGTIVASGNASWYGPGFAGRHTANGEIFDPNDLTAAHRTLPFNTRVLVTNVHSGASVVVRINDRGPFKDNRIIDLSRAAADVIGLTGAGVGPVHLSLLGGSGVVTAAPDTGLSLLEVVARNRQPGEILLISSALNPDLPPQMVRVVSSEVPTGSGADLLLSDALWAQLGADILVDAEN